METDELVIKRDGSKEPMSFDKILNRIKKVGEHLAVTGINYSQLTIKVIDQLHNGISTAQIDELLAEQCIILSTKNLGYGTLAAGMIHTAHHKNVGASFVDAITKLHEFRNVRGEVSPLISDQVYQYAVANADWIDGEVLDHSRDFLIDYFGFKTLERAYLFRIDGKMVERVQHMWMRVAVGIHCQFIDKVGPEATRRAIKETYDLMSQKYFIHATPTLFNSGTPRSQLSSCFLLAMESDSIDGIFNTVKDCALISKYGGGIGVHIHNVRAKGSHIGGTNGTSNGIVPMLRVFNNTARYVDQGGGKRCGSFAIYLEPHHADIEDFLEMKKNHGNEEIKARDLFYALWVSDLFMERVKEKGQWSLFCPNECPGLADVWGDEFRALYMRYEAEGRARRTMSAVELWLKILDAQMETGMPYLLYKDAANRKSNQKHSGVIKSSNLCTEIMEISDVEETAVCNLASIALGTFVNRGAVAGGTVVQVGGKYTPWFDYAKLHEVTKVATRNLNRVIDVNYYPTEKARVSNMRHRPIGIGVQGLADTFIMMNMAFDSDAAKEINRLIFETMYHAALEASCEEARDWGGPYETFAGSPVSQGELQFDMWGVVPTAGRYDWEGLKEAIKRHGLRNSLLLTAMPTASTSQILGFNECIEPLTNNIYTRRTLAGEFIVVNKYLMGDLIELGVWDDKLKTNIIANQGSVQHLPDEVVPQAIKDKYKTVWEIKMKNLIDMSADRGAYICQSQSLNLWMEEPTYGKLGSMHFYSWSRGLKTGLYYLRRKAKHRMQQFTIEPERGNNVVEEDDSGGCDLCFS